MSHQPHEPQGMAGGFRDRICGEDGAAQRSRLLFVRHRHDSSQIGQLLVRTKGDETAFAGGSNSTTLVGTPPITAQWSLICACSSLLHVGPGQRSTATAHADSQNGRGQVAFGLQLQALAITGRRAEAEASCAPRGCTISAVRMRCVIPRICTPA